MGYVFAISGTLIALNIGIVAWFSEDNEAEPNEGVVEVEDVSVDQAVEPQEQPQVEAQPNQAK